jgi:hypothetical protein
MENYEADEQLFKLMSELLMEWEIDKQPTRVFTIANNMGKNKLAAARIRLRYLIPKIHSLGRFDSDVARHWISEYCTEAIYLLKHCNVTLKVHTKNQVTDEMKEHARWIPIDSVVDFDRNKKALAWCHSDNRPSLYIASRLNLACCPVCDKRFNPIEVLMSRDGYKFYDAVRALQ